MDDISGARVLVTGGAGFVGSNLAEQFAEMGAHVRVLDNLSTGNLRNIDGLDVEFVEGDIRDLDAVLKAADGIDYVLHHAAVASVPESTRDPLGSSDVNISGTLNVLEASARQDVKRMVFASSASVYGQGDNAPITETLPIKPCSPYAASKAAGEAMCHAYASSMGVETVSLRYFNIFGKRQDPRSHYAGVIPVFIDSLRKGEPAVIFGDGLQTRDFVFVDDVVQANLLACLQPDISMAAFNIGHGRSVSIMELAEGIATAMNLSLVMKHLPIRVGDVRHSLADITLARTALGYSPKTTFAQGLSQTIDWFEATRGGYRGERAG